MTKFTFTAFILGLSLFLIDIPSGLGWIVGWISIVILDYSRENILKKIIDFDNFSVTKYVGYLLGVAIWIAIPLLLSFRYPGYVNPLSIFGAYFTDRIIMFVTKSFVKEGH